MEAFVKREKAVIKVATKYHGIVSKLVLTYEEGISLIEAGRLLEHFVQEGEAKKFDIGGITYYDLPATRSYLSKLENEIITKILTLGGSVSKIRLITEMDLPAPTVDEALKRLVDQNILYYNTEIDTYELMTFKICSNCRSRIPIESDRCPKCGAPAS